jgi:hypothetical protein
MLRELMFSGEIHLEIRLGFLYVRVHWLGFLYVREHMKYPAFFFCMQEVLRCMRMYICMCTVCMYVHVCMHACMYARMHVCIHDEMDLKCADTHTNTHTDSLSLSP